MPAHLEDSYSLITQETEEKTGSFAAIINPITYKELMAAQLISLCYLVTFRDKIKAIKIKSKGNSLVWYIAMCGFVFPTYSQQTCRTVFNLVLKCAMV